jgi:membrane protein
MFWRISSLAISVVLMNGKLKGRKLHSIYELARDSAYACVQGNLFTHGAALAYYTVFAIAPMFVIALAIAGFCFGRDAASHELFGQVQQLIGHQGAQAIQTAVSAAAKVKTGLFATAVAIGTLLVASTGVFVQLQNSLNHFWGVQPQPGRTIRNFIRHRVMSFAMVVGIGFLLLVSLVVNAGLNAVGEFFGRFLSAQAIVLQIADPIVSLLVITLLFTMIFKVLPDLKIAWRDVWFGGLATAILFNIGKNLIGLYLAHSSVTSIYGAVGSLVVILVWVYYSSLILFLGGQLTCEFANRFGTRPQPVRGARFLPPPPDAAQ